MNHADILEQQLITTNRQLVNATVQISQLVDALDEANKKIAELIAKDEAVASAPAE